MKSSVVLILFAVSAVHMPYGIAADKTDYLERTAQKNLERADRHEQKAEDDVAQNKPHGATKHAHKAAVDEIKSDKQEQRVQAKRQELNTTP